MPHDETRVVGYLRQTHNTTLLSDREKHLVGLAVTMTRGCQGGSFSDLGFRAHS